MYSGDESYGDEITSGLLEDSGYQPGDEREVREPSDRIVARLAERLIEAGVPIAHVAEFGRAEWDAVLADICAEEYEGTISDAIAARVTCRMLREQIGGRA